MNPARTTKRMRHALVGLLLVASTAHAETWQQIAEFKAKGSVMFLDTEGITRAGKHAKARLKLLYNSDQAIPEGYGGLPPDVSTYRWDTNDYDFNCSKRAVALNRSILYSADNQLVGHMDIPKRAREFRPVQPGSAPERILDTVCNWGKARKDKAMLPAQVTNAADPASFVSADSVQRQEQGSTIIKACVGPDHLLLREPIVTRTSGHPDLDAAAIKVAKAARYSAATENGVPLPESCTQFKVKFVLKE